MNNPYFSIIMPVYNASKHLRSTIESVLNQSERDFEMIMIDDGSSDNSLAIMLEMANQDHRLKTVSQNNQGVSKTRNLGVDLANGEYLAFIDADDIWQPEKLMYHRKLHEEKTYTAASYAKIAFVDDAAIDDQKAKTFSSVLRQSLKIDDIIAENPVCTTSNLVVNRNVFIASGGFDENMSHAEDQEWLARIIDQGHQVCGINEHLVDYRLSPDGLSFDLPAMYAGWKKLSDTYGAKEGRKGAEAVFLRYLSRRALRAGAPANVAILYAIQGLRSDSSAFLQDPKRGWLTIISACAGLFLPRSKRIQIFA